MVIKTDEAVEGLSDSDGLVARGLGPEGGGESGGLQYICRLEMSKGEGADSARRMGGDREWTNVANAEADSC